MKFKRLFTFGCSYTEYLLPTWANIVAWDLSIPAQNWGQSGIGNVGIFHKMVECDLKNTFNEDDLILVVWSSWSREDRYAEDRYGNYTWLTGGNVFSNPYYGEEFVKKYWSLSNDIIKNSTAIISANKMFDIKFQGHIENTRFFESKNIEFNNYEKDIFNFYRPHIPSGNVFVLNHKDRIHDEFFKLYNDGHPNLLEHLKYVKEIVYKTLNFTLKKETEEFCYKLHDEFIKTLNDNKNCSVDEKKTLIGKILKRNDATLTQSRTM
jgi:hypothetical protein